MYSFNAARQGSSCRKLFCVFLGSVEAVRGLGKQIADLVDDGKFQEARPLLSGFASEVVIRTTSLPLATYPDAI